MGRLDGKRALISGTGGGIGRATALRFAREGAHVVGCDLNPETSSQTVELTRAAGGRMDALAPVDLATEEGARRWVDDAVGLAGGVDILVNNASAIRFGGLRGSAGQAEFAELDELDLGALALRRPQGGLQQDLGAAVGLAAAQPEDPPARATRRHRSSRPQGLARLLSL